MKAWLIVAALALAAGAAPASAQSTSRAAPTVAAVLDACTTDLKARCGGEPLAFGRVAACLRRSTDALEAGCRAFVTGLRAPTQRESLRPARDAVDQACAADVKSACGADLTTRARGQCFRTHIDKMSEGCRSAMAELRRLQASQRERRAGAN